MATVLFLAGLLLAYTNGANDNMKGVATLLGSRTLDYARALQLGTVATLLGSVGAVLLSGTLVVAFSGKGVVPEAVVGDPSFLSAVGGGAAAVVLIATVLGIPVSTTHALVGGIAGAGAAVVGPSNLHWGALGGAFAIPLLTSPFLAAAVVGLAYPAFRKARRAAGIQRESCLCVGEELVPVASEAAAARIRLALSTGRAPECRTVYRGRILGVTADRVLGGAHALSAATVSFARGLNDTPKIAALLLAAGSLGTAGSMIAVGAGMAVGAALQARRVGHTMSFRVTEMNAGQGFTANLATAAVVLGASALGVPVSTTHVSVGALFGLGAATRTLVRRTLARILLAWVVTLPAAFLAAALLLRLLAA